MKIKFIRSYGPYKTGETVEMSVDHALWFVRNAVAVKTADIPKAAKLKKAKK